MTAQKCKHVFVREDTDGDDYQCSICMRFVEIPHEDIEVYDDGSEEEYANEDED